MNRGQFCNFKFIKMSETKTCMHFEGYQMETLALKYNLCESSPTNQMLTDFKNNASEQSADRLVYKLPNDRYIDSRWWELPDEV